MRAILALVLLLAGLQPALGAKMALVVGNSAYKHANPLANPETDASAFAAFLEASGFAVTTLTDATKDEMAEAVETFAEALTPDDAAVFFYAGHGVQAAGENFLVGVDARFRNAADVPEQSLGLTELLSSIEGRAGLAMIFIDACRNNPLADALKAEDVKAGLAPVEPQGDGTMIAFAAAPGRVAFDGAGEHSPFTSALLDHLGDPGVEVGVAFRRVMRDVRDLTRDRQAPQLVSSLSGEFFFGSPVAPELSADEAARDFERAKRLGSVRAWTLYLEKYPEGELSEMARAALQERLGELWNTEEGIEPDEAEERINFGRQGRLEVQVALSELGYELGTPDGLFGPKSRGAIAEFQRKAGIAETGYLSFSLLAELGIPFVDDRASSAISGASKVYSVADIEGLETDSRLINAMRCFAGRKIAYGFFGGHLYVAVDDGAANLCGGYLATIGSAAENNFVFSMIRNDSAFWDRGSNEDPLWWASGPMFGFRQGSGAREPNGGWGWVTGEPVSFTAWAEFQPDDFENRQDVAHFQVFSRSGPPGLTQPTWDDASGIGDIIVEFD